MVSLYWLSFFTINGDAEDPWKNLVWIKTYSIINWYTVILQYPVLHYPEYGNIQLTKLATLFFPINPGCWNTSNCCCEDMMSCTPVTCCHLISTFTCTVTTVPMCWCPQASQPLYKPHKENNAWLQRLVAKVAVRIFLLIALIMICNEDNIQRAPLDTSNNTAGLWVTAGVMCCTFNYFLW